MSMEAAKAASPPGEFPVRGRTGPLRASGGLLIQPGRPKTLKRNQLLHHTPA
jgi:hypothetical protein